MGKRTDLNATPYGDWLVRAFDHWVSRESPVSHRSFEAIIKGLLGLPSGVESFGLSPVDLIVIETNGEIEGVDALKATFDGASKLHFDVFRHDFNTVSVHEAVQSRQLGIESLCTRCQACSLVSVCGGGYVPHRYSADHGFNNPSVYCADLEKLIHHIQSRVCSELQGTQETVEQDNLRAET